MFPWEEALETFAPTPEAALERTSLLRRTDTKFIVPAEVVGRWARALSREYTLLHAGNNKVAAYRTLYFDTPDLAMFQAHRCGRRVRQKVRIRHYVDRKLSFLEVKLKTRPSCTVKNRQARAYGDNRLTEGDMAFLRTHMDLEGRLCPQVWTNFRRVTLVGKDLEERLTVDFGLEFSWDNKKVCFENMAILEVKQPRFSRAAGVMLALRDAGFRPEAVSKYCAAIATLCPSIPHNRMLPSIRHIERMENI